MARTTIGRRGWLVALTGCLTGCLVVLAATPGGSPAAADPVPWEPGADLVQPGMLVQVDGAPTCTGGFLFDGVGRLRGKVFLGLAAHCVEDRIGLRVSDERGRAFGRVAFSFWPYQTFADDFAFVEVDRTAWRRTSPAMAGYPDLPSRLGTAELVRVGHRVQLSGWGFATRTTRTGREGRTGVVNDFTDRLWGAEAPVSNTDSGGPAADLDSGAAIGSVSNFCVPLPIATSEGFRGGCTVYGPTVERIVTRAAGLGFPVRLRTAQQGPPRATP